MPHFFKELIFMSKSHDTKESKIFAKTMGALALLGISVTGAYLVNEKMQNNEGGLRFPSSSTQNEEVNKNGN
jgi:hypothetical protein